MFWEIPRFHSYCSKVFSYVPVDFTRTVPKVFVYILVDFHLNHFKYFSYCSRMFNYVLGDFTRTVSKGLVMFREISFQLFQSFQSCSGRFHSHLSKIQLLCVRFYSYSSKVLPACWRIWTVFVAAKRFHPFPRQFRRGRFKPQPRIRISFCNVKLAIITRDGFYDAVSVVEKSILKFTVFFSIQHSVVFWAFFEQFHENCGSTLTVSFSYDQRHISIVDGTSTEDPTLSHRET